MDYIFNLAGNVSHLDSMLHPQHDLAPSCAAQLALLEACRHYNPHVKLVFTSTRQIYGKPVYVPVDEQHRLAPLPTLMASVSSPQSIIIDSTTPITLRVPCACV